MSRKQIVPVLVFAAVVGAGMIVLQRWVAETRGAAIVLVAAFLVASGVVALVVSRRRPELRVPLLGTFGAIVLGTVLIGWATGFRDDEVSENVVMANERVAEADRDSALAGGNGGSPADEPKEPSGPVEIAQGSFTGADGHTGAGTATVVRDTDGSRSLTFTDFEVDPGPGIVVWLTRDPESLDDRIELGGLKGNVGDQQYELPADADLREYDTVVLYCTPFTVRIAVAPLS